MPGPLLDRHSALFLDVDGTLLDIALTPEDVLVPQGLGQSLQRVFDLLGGAVALISGRSVADLDHLLSPMKLPAAGKHGAEVRLRRGGPTRELATSRINGEVRRGLAQVAHDHDGVMLEDKGVSIAVHYRRRPEIAEALGSQICSLLAECGNGLVLLPGRMVWEVKDKSVSKAAAVRRFMTEPPFAIRRPVYIGDDVTDEDGFAEVERRGGVALVVAGGEIRGRSIAFEDPRAVRQWLLDQPKAIRA